MNLQRVLAFSIIALGAVTFSYSSHTTVLPIMIVAIALIGVPGRIGTTIASERGVILSLALALPFVVMWRLSPYKPPDGSGSFGYPVTYAFGLYFLAVQALQFFINKESELPATVPAYGVFAMVCAGNIYATTAQDRIYQLLSLFFAVLAALYLVSSTRMVPAARTRRTLGRSFFITCMLVFALLGGGFSGIMLRRYERSLSGLLVGIFYRRPRMAETGFSGIAKLGSLTRMSLGIGERRIALRVFSSREPGYLRGRAYVKYGESQWGAFGDRVKLSPSEEIPEGVDPPQGKVNLFALRDTKTSSWDVMDVWPDPAIEEGMFAPLGTELMSVAVESLEVDEHGLTDSGELVGGMNYTEYVAVEGAPDVFPEERRKYLTSLPRNLDPRIRELAEEIFKGCASTGEKIDAVVRYFNANYRYKKGIRVPDGADPLTHFLMEKPAAHCEYFASGAAVLLRITGVPARYITGFLTLERSPYGGYWIARNRNAHAWVEAYDDARGWMRVEATPPDGVPSPLTAGKFGYMWDHIKFRLLELQVLTRTRGLRGLGMWVRQIPRGWLPAFLSLSPLAVGLKLCVALVLILLLWRKCTGRRWAPAVDVRVRTLHTLLAQMDARLRKRNIIRRDSETLHQFAQRITGVQIPRELTGDFANWYRDYASVRYGGSITEGDIEKLKVNT